ncbi:MAG: YybH family protein [Omnitrophica WOR_2 bacterium]
MQTNVSTAVQEDIHAALVKWIEAVEGRELDSLPEVVAQDNDLVWIGADTNDWITGFAELQKAMQAQNEALHDTRITVSDEAIHSYLETNLAWATNRWVFRARAGEQDIELLLRCTWVLEKRASGWRIVHFHKSVGMSG